MVTADFTSRTHISIPRKALTGIYRKMSGMKRSYEELDHMMAQIEELSGKSIKTSAKTLAHDLGY